MKHVREESELEIRTLRNKHDANVEFLKQEQSMGSAKVRTKSLRW